VLPGESEGIVICFDDGERSVYDYAFPILKKFGMKAIVFLIVDYIGKKNLWDIGPSARATQHLNWDEILKMKSWGIEFGSHTMSHCNLTRLTTTRLEYELRESKRILEAKIGKVRSISYPFNRVNKVIVKRARQAGYKFGFGGDGSCPLLLKKEAVYIIDNQPNLAVKISETPQFFYCYEKIKQQVINYFTIATMLKMQHF